MRAFIAIALVLAIAPAARADGPTRNDAIVHVPLFIVDAAGNPITPSTSPDTLVFEARKHNPILSTDGHQLTLVEFNAPQGSAAVKCVNEGTHAVLHLTGLVPNAVYTVWLLAFRAPGFDPTFANLIGLGALGPADGSANVMLTDASGEGAVSAIASAGPLSIFGSVPACAPTGLYEFHLVAAYHIDGQTHGSTPGPDGTYVEQLGFIFH
jgi:hypothetical protein